MKNRKFLGVPYNFKKPTLKLIKERLWNLKDSRVLTPKVFGWGWSINFYQVLRKLKIIK